MPSVGSLFSEVNDAPSHDPEVEDDIRDKFKAGSCRLFARTDKKHKSCRKMLIFEKNMDSE